MGEQADINGIAAPVKRKKRVVMIMTPEEELAAEKLKNQQLMSEMVTIFSLLFLIVILNKFIFRAE